MKNKSVSYISKVVAVSIIVVILLLSVNIASAHEFNPPRRFIDVGTTGALWWKHPQVQFKVFWLTSNSYSTAITNAMSNWNNNSDSYVYIQSGPYSYPETRVYAWDHIWEWGSQYAATASTTESGKITQAHIYVNKSTTDSWGLDDKEHNVGHEFGHVLGLNDTNVSGIETILAQGRGSTLGWTNYDKPKSHDRSDLAEFYPN